MINFQKRIIEEVTNNLEYHSPVIFASATGVGKTLTAYEVEKQTDAGIWVARKWKWRYLDEVPRPEDGTTRDARKVKGERHYGRLKESPETSLEFRTGDTLHLLHKGDSERTDKHSLYMADSWHSHKTLFSHFSEREPITIYLFTHKKLIDDRVEQRKKQGFFTSEQAEKRAETLDDEVAAFEKYGNVFDCTFCIYPSDLYLEGFEHGLEKKIESDAARVIRFIEEYKKFRREYFDSYFKPERDEVGTSWVHHYFINEISKDLTGFDLEETQKRVEAGSSVTVRLNKELELAEKKKIIIPNEYKQMISKGIPVIGYARAHGRYTLMLKSKSKRDGGVFDPNDIISDLIELKIGEPTLRATVSGQDGISYSNFGLVHITKGYFNDALMYSLGDPLVGIHQHAALAIGFVDPVWGERHHTEPCDIEIMPRLGYPGNLAAKPPDYLRLRYPSNSNGTKN